MGKKKSEDFDPTDPVQQERAKKRRLKRPFEFIVSMPDQSKATQLVRSDGTPNRAAFKLGKFKIETIGDLAKFDAMWRNGLLFPVPDMSLQVLNVILDILGLVEDDEESGKG